MKDALGGIINIWFIAVFIVIISGYLAFSVQYNKAFRMKNEIIKALEQCDGVLDNCADEIIDKYQTQIGYNVGQYWNYAGKDNSEECLYKQEKGYYICRHTVKCATPGKNGCTNSDELGEQIYYTVATAVNTDIPIFRNIIPNMSAFQVTGNTKRITLH